MVEHQLDPNPPPYSCERSYPGRRPGLFSCAPSGLESGPVETVRLCECRFLDIDHDRDVDLADFGAFQNLFTGEN